MTQSCFTALGTFSTYVVLLDSYIVRVGNLADKLSNYRSIKLSRDVWRSAPGVPPGMTDRVGMWTSIGSASKTQIRTWPNPAFTSLAYTWQYSGNVHSPDNRDVYIQIWMNLHEKRVLKEII